jgi:hypothetical protein
MSQSFFFWEGVSAAVALDEATAARIKNKDATNVNTLALLPLLAIGIPSFSSSTSLPLACRLTYGVKPDRDEAAQYARGREKTRPERL